MKISISALSVAYGLTSEALRYYEEKELLMPDRTSAGGHRRFSIADMQRLGIIKSLQRQGFSLDEVREVMTCCSKDQLIAMMDEKRAQFNREITHARAIHARLTASTDLLRDSDRLLMRPRLCQGGAAYLLGFDSVAALWKSVPAMPLLKDLIDALPLTSYCTIVPLGRLQGEDLPMRTGIVAPAEYLTLIQADLSQMRVSAGPRMVRTLFELCPPKDGPIEPVIRAAQAFIAREGLTPVSDGYTRQHTWYTNEHGKACHFAELFIPVGD